MSTLPTSHLRQRSTDRYRHDSPISFDSDSTLYDTTVRYSDEKKLGKSRWEQTSNGSALSWRESRKSRFSWKHVGLVLAFVGAGTGGWFLRGENEPSLHEPESTFDASRSCNGYKYHGVLLVNSTTPSENKWEPISAPSQCTPLDFLSSLSSTPNEVDLEFARNKTILLFGDSVDRDHVEHFCQFVGGEMEVVNIDHPASPPHPVGQEIAPEDYVQHWDGSRNWPNFDQSRPHICYVRRLNLLVANVFHYGMFESSTSKWVEYHPHYYPPATVQDRFDLIVVPFLAKLAKIYETNPIPDLISISTGFWGITRMVEADDSIQRALIASGETNLEKLSKFDALAEMTRERKDFIEEKIISLIEHIADAWPVVHSSTPSGENIRAPKILWRALHHIKEHHTIPLARIQTIDQIARRSVERLIERSHLSTLPLSSSHSPFSALSTLFRTRFSRELNSPSSIASTTRSLEISRGLADRLELDDWGAKMLGQERHFRDDIHPLPLPGSWLYGNMLLLQLKLAVEERSQ